MHLGKGMLEFRRVCRFIGTEQLYDADSSLQKIKCAFVSEDRIKFKFGTTPKTII